ncbi:hypothetical protein [Pedobacter sp. NJ-S-72]
MHEQIQRIKNKLKQLKEADTELEQFGAENHEYLLNPVLKADEVKQFESVYQVSLPEEYVAFLTMLGNGGAGPFYGVNKLVDSQMMYFDNSEKAAHSYFDLSKPFPYTERWHVDEELAVLYEKVEQAYEAGDEELEEELLKEKMKLIDLII